MGVRRHEYSHATSNVDVRFFSEIQRRAHRSARVLQLELQLRVARCREQGLPIRWLLALYDVFVSYSTCTSIRTYYTCPQKIFRALPRAEVAYDCPYAILAL